MGLKVQIDEEKERIFRQKAFQKFGYKKGSLSAALEEAVDIWLRTQNNISKINNPTERISGMLEQVKERSVELQHLATKLFLKESE
ncbi:MAG: hypothetical protein KAS95_07355 [Candidatus Heimdallarchaeota archaeon]|nr:hypothetical protein [Candidatus Heimdallarchaeota archaeon]